MVPLLIVVGVAVVALILLSLSPGIVQQDEQGALFRLDRVIGTKPAGLTLIIPVVDMRRRVSVRMVTMPIESQGIITRRLRGRPLRHPRLHRIGQLSSGASYRCATSHRTIS